MKAGKSGSDEVQHAILQLLAKGPLRYTPFLKALEHKPKKGSRAQEPGKYAKLTILKNLQILKSEKLVKKTLKDGRPEYSITVKGLDRLAEYGTDQVKIALKNMLALRDIPQEIYEKWKAEPRQAAYQARSNEERLDIVMAMYSTHWGDLLKAYREVHNMVCKLAYKRAIADDLFLGFTDTGALCAIRRRELKEHGLLDEEEKSQP